MKHFLIVSQLFYPRESAIVNCLYTLIKNIICNGDKVTVLSVAYDDTTPLREEKDGYTIIRILSKEQLFIDKITTRLDRLHLSFLILPIAKIWMIFRPFVENVRMNKLYKAYAKTEKIDYILSTLEPKQNHDAAYKMAASGSKWIMLNYDVFVYNIIRSQNIEKCKKREAKWVSRAAAVLNLDGIPQENEKNNYYPYKEIKNDIMYLTNLNFTSEPIIEKHNKFIMRYTGKIYYKGKGIKPDKGLEECDEVINFLKSFNSEKYSAEFFGSCDVCLNSEYSELPDCVKVMGNVSVDKCRELIHTADALINISTCTSCLVPSKILEYIASGKPIINFYHTDDDPSFQYLRQYPAVINIKFGEKPNIEQIQKKLYEMDIVSKTELNKIYENYLSESVTERMITFIKSI